MVILFNLIIYIMDLTLRWQSGSEWHSEDVCIPVTDKEKVVFAECILAAVEDGWDISVCKCYSIDESDEYDTTD